MENIDFTIAPPKKRYEHVAESLERVIVQSVEDEKLPSEQELAERFNVSKAVIREALTVLKERGLIQSRNGDGSYVSKPGAETAARAVSRIITTNCINNQNLHDARLILETATVRLAAVNAAPGEIARLEATIAEMSDLTMPYDEWLAIDMDFHVAIARAGKNELLAMFVEMMMLLLKKYMLKGLYSNYDQTCTLNEHREIVNAMRTGNPDLCEQAVRAHFNSAWNHVAMYEKRQNATG
ncbi:MAG: FadR family transcriptional regulator [Planctomycetota bacterium]|jgi:GntR family transcriptional repressor for pyruvate dehydrogenase complex|nr:FadR family transcriptional regulator [Planctomycetota bacterium]